MMIPANSERKPFVVVIGSAQRNSKTSALSEEWPTVAESRISCQECWKTEWEKEN